MRKGSMRLFVAALAFSLAACSVPTPTTIEGAQAVGAVLSNETTANVFRCIFSISNAVFRDYPSKDAKVYPKQPDRRIEEWTIKNPVIRTTVDISHDQLTEKRWLAGVIDGKMIFLLEKEAIAKEPCTIHDEQFTKIRNDEDGKFPRIPKRVSDGIGYEPVGEVRIRLLPGYRR